MLKQMRRLAIEIGLGIIALVIIVASIKAHYNLKQQYVDLKQANQIEQNNTLLYRRVNDSLTVAFVKTQVVSQETAKIVFKSELEAYEKQTGNKIKNLESLLKTQIKGQNNYYFNNIDTAYCDSLNLSYKDKFSEIDIQVKDGVAVVNTKTYTSLTKYTYKARRKEPWYKPWKWGKDLRTEIKSDNPKDSIVNIKEIIIE